MSAGSLVGAPNLTYPRIADQGAKRTGRVYTKYGFHLEPEFTKCGDYRSLVSLDARD